MYAGPIYAYSCLNLIISHMLFPEKRLILDDICLRVTYDHD